MNRQDGSNFFSKSYMYNVKFGSLNIILKILKNIRTAFIADFHRYRKIPVCLSSRTYTIFGEMQQKRFICYNKIKISKDNINFYRGENNVTVINTWRDYFDLYRESIIIVTWSWSRAWLGPSLLQLPIPKSLNFQNKKWSINSLPRFSSLYHIVTFRDWFHIT